MSNPAGWFPQPDGQQRYWDGEQWTEHVAPGPAPVTTPGGSWSGFESLVPCKTCKSPVSMKASACPNCGRGRPGGGTSTGVFILFCIVLVLFALWII